MNRDRRRELTAAYKERKARPGVFAVRCPAAGLTWVGAARELENRQPGIWFMLRLGQHRNKPLQAAWAEHGEEAFVYEELEAIDADGLSAWAVNHAVKDRAAHWLGALDAAAL